MWSWMWLRDLSNLTDQAKLMLSIITWSHCDRKWIDTYFFWNARTGSFSRSVMSIPLPLADTSGCFLHSNQPMCAKKKPRVALCGSASVSEYLWWTRWSRAQCIAQSWNAIVLNMANSILSGVVALYDRCAHNRCAPPVIPKPEAKYNTMAARKR